MSVHLEKFRTPRIHGDWRPDTARRPRFLPGALRRYPSAISWFEGLILLSTTVKGGSQ